MRRLRSCEFKSRRLYFHQTPLNPYGFFFLALWHLISPIGTDQRISCSNRIFMKITNQTSILLNTKRSIDEE